MLGKLLKYDIKSIIKYLCIFYSLAVFFGLLTRLFFSVENSLVMNIIGQICQGTAISMMFSIVINNLMRMWVRFKINLYGDESYLTHTLPINRETVYISKILASVITLFISVAVITFTLFVAYYSKEDLEFIKNMLLPIADSYDTSITLLITAIMLVLFLEFANILQCGFTGIILGHRMNSAKIGFSVLFGFVVYMISQVIVIIVMFAVALFNNDFMNLFITNEAVNISVIKTALYIAIIGYTLVFLIGLAINIKLFKKGVNVD